MDRCLLVILLLLKYSGCSTYLFCSVYRLTEFTGFFLGPSAVLHRALSLATRFPSLNDSICSLLMTFSSSSLVCIFAIFKSILLASYCECKFAFCIASLISLRSSISFSMAILVSLMVPTMELMSHYYRNLFLSSIRSMIACFSFLSNSNWLSSCFSWRKSCPYKLPPLFFLV